LRNLNQDTITQAVIARLSDTPDARLKEVLTCVVQHLHAFAREVHLTESELQAGIEFLTAVGNKCSPSRQEFVLLADVLGLSTLTVAMNHDKPAGCTEATTSGPFYLPDAQPMASGSDLAGDAPGQPCQVRGRVCALDGGPVAAAQVEVWQSDADGRYDVQYEDLGGQRARGVFSTGSDGRFELRSVLACPYPVPEDGPVGQLMRASRGHPWRPAHMHFRISAPGFETLVTQVYREDDPYLDSDPVYGVRQSLVAPWVPDEQGLYTLDFDFVLQRRRGGQR
jgi:hydroxyquinol 1,2-dioxygenase